MKNSNDAIGNQTRDLPACSVVPQPTCTPDTDWGKPRYWEGKSVTVTLYSLQISHGPAWDGTRDSAVTGQRYTA